MKASTTEELVWITFELLVTRLSIRMGWIGALIAPLAALVAPRLVDFGEVCATVPPDPPEIDWYELAITGQLYRAPLLSIQWLWATFLVEAWNEYCECAPGPDTSGTCPQLGPASYSGSVANSVYQELAPDFEFGIGDWTNAKVDFVRQAGSGTMDLRLQWLQITGGVETIIAGYGSPSPGWGLNSVSLSATVGATATTTIWKPPHRTDANRFNPSTYDDTKSVWLRTKIARPGFTGPFAYTISVNAYVLPTSAVCGVASPDPDPYVPPAAPVDPELPAPPAGPIGCTTDDLCTLLYNLGAAVGELSVEVDELAARHAPIAYSVGTVHVGLTGAGELAVADLAGARVQLTAVPSTWGYRDRSPLRYAPAPVELQFGNASSLGEACWIHYADELVRNPVDLVVTRLRYNVGPGVVATVTTLLRPAG